MAHAQGTAAQLRDVIDNTLLLISSDHYVSGFQSIGQYRTGLTEFIQAGLAAIAAKPSTPHPTTTNEENNMLPIELLATVPATTFPDGSTEPSFRAGRYLSCKGEDGAAKLSATEKPWVEIDYSTARAVCALAGGALITERQWLAIAINITQQDINWTGGKVGNGNVFMGLHLGTVDEAQGAFESPDANERRWHELSNGERIFDFSGNVYSWVFDNVQGDVNGIVDAKFADDSLSISLAPFPCMENGMGWRPDAGIDWAGNALIRGGCWDDGDHAGVFSLGGTGPGRRYGSVGFRCTKP